MRGSDCHCHWWLSLFRINLGAPRPQGVAEKTSSEPSQPGGRVVFPPHRIILPVSFFTFSFQKTDRDFCLQFFSHMISRDFKHVDHVKHFFCEKNIPQPLERNTVAACGWPTFALRGADGESPPIVVCLKKRDPKMKGLGWTIQFIWIHLGVPPFLGHQKK